MQTRRASSKFIGATGGTELRFTASGDKATAAVDHLVALVPRLDSQRPRWKASNWSADPDSRACPAASGRLRPRARESSRRPRRAGRGDAELVDSEPDQERHELGSPAASPQTSTASLRMRGADDSAMDPGPPVGRGLHGCQRPLTVETERVLHEVVGPDREESASAAISSARPAASGVSIIAPSSGSEPASSDRARRARCSTPRPRQPGQKEAQIGRGAARQDGPQLSLESLRVGERESRPPLPTPARNGGVLSAPKSSVRTVAMPGEERSAAPAPQRVLPASASLMLRGRRARCEQPDAFGAGREPRGHFRGVPALQRRRILRPSRVTAGSVATRPARATPSAR